jgi:uncharacterized protein (TIGR00369 family)
MTLKVLRKQENSRMCFACGLENPAGLRGSFYELEDGSLVGRYSPRPEWQGYPGRLHGGIASAMLDEVLSRVVMAGKTRETWGVTSELKLSFKRPVPMEGEIIARGRILKEGGRVYEAAGEILLPDGTPAVEATGRFLKLALGDIVGEGEAAEGLEWAAVRDPGDPGSFDIPG